MIKKLYTALLFLISFVLLSEIQAQNLQVSLNVSSHPNPYISEWTTHHEMAILTITNPSSSTVEAKIHAKVSVDESVKAETKMEAMQVISIPPGVSTYYGDQIVPADAIKFYGDVEKTAIKTGMLPAGTYQICVDLLYPQTLRPMTYPACKQFTITAYQHPDLMLPENKKVLASSDKMFRWTPVIPAPPGGVRYRLIICELIPGQSAANVIRTGASIFEREISNQTQLFWPTDFVLPEGSKEYVWSVQSLYDSGNPIGDQDGWAEPFTFSTKGKKDSADTGGTTAKIKLAGVVKDFYNNTPVAGASVVYHAVQRSMRRMGSRLSITYNDSQDSLVTATDANGLFEFPDVRDATYFSLHASKPGYLYTSEKTSSQYQLGSITDYVLLVKPNLGSITGYVIDSLTGKDIDNITVELWQKRKAAVKASMKSASKHSVSNASSTMKISSVSKSSSYLSALDVLIASVKSGLSGGGKIKSPSQPTKPTIHKPTKKGAFTFEDVPGDDGYFIVINDSRFKKLTTAQFTVPGDKNVDKGLLRIQPKVGTIEGWVKEEGTNKPLVGAYVYLYSDVGSSILVAEKFIDKIGGKSDLTSLGGKDWNPAVGNVPSLGDLKGYTKAQANNLPYVYEKSNFTVNTKNSEVKFGTGGIKLESSPSSGSGKASGTKKELTNWSDVSLWSPVFTDYGQKPPPTMPDSGSLYAPVTTDGDGHFIFTNVRINDPNQISDRYAVWAKTTGYYDAMKNARLTTDGGNVKVTLTTKIAKGIIYGKVIAEVDNAPLGGVKVELEKGSNTANLAFTNPDGTYTLFNIDNGTYDGVKFSKSGVNDYVAPGPIEIVNGTVVKLDASIKTITGTIKATIRDDTKAPMYGVMVHSSDVPSISATSFADGNAIIPNAPVGKLHLTFTQPGYTDVIKEVEVKENETATVEVEMTGYKGSITVIVQDAITKLPIANATVTLKDTLQTDLAGQAVFKSIPVGTKTVTVVADTNVDKPDYKIVSTTVDIKKDVNAPLLINMVKGGRISGTVENKETLAGVDSVTVTVDGVTGIEVFTTSDGKFTLRNVPVGASLTLIASKSGYKTVKMAGVALAAGEQKTDIILQIEKSPILTLFGFQIEVETITDKPGGHHLVTGSIVKVPNNSVMDLQGKDPKFPFKEVEVDNDYKPVAKSYFFDFSEVKVKVFKMDGTMKSESDFLKVTYIDSVGAGQISGSTIILDKLIPTWIPGSKWADEKITWAAGQLPASFYSDGVFHGNVKGLGINAQGSTITAEFFGFKLSVDYKKTTIDDKGFHYYGALSIPGISTSIGIEDLNIILKDSTTGSVKFNKVTVNTTPPLSLNLGLFKIVDNSTTWDESGFKAKGDIYLTALGNKKFGFHDLLIANNGDFLGITVDLDPSNGTISVLGSLFQIKSLGFGTDATSKKKFFTFSGKLTIAQFNKPVEFQNLKYTQDGDFTGTIAFNQSMTFVNVVTVQLQAVEFGKDKNNVKNIFIKGGISFSIPLLSVQVGNFRFYENHTYAIEQIGAGFTAGPVTVAVLISWSNDVFEGSCSLIIPCFSVTAQFRYADSNDWWIKIKAGLPPIPIGGTGLFVVGVSGELGHKGSTWIYGFGGSVTVGPAKEAIKLDLEVKVTTTPTGPIIQGFADVIVLENFAVGHAEITLDFPNKRFTGSINFGWNTKVIKMNSWVAIEVKAGDYWYVGAGVKTDIIGLIQFDAQAYIARNYNGNMHTLPVRYHPNNTTLNGFHADLRDEKGFGKAGDKWSLKLSQYLFGSIDWNEGIAAGIHYQGIGSFDLWIIGGSAEIDIEADVKYINNELTLHGNFGTQIKLWVGCCGASDGCPDACFYYGIPCGAKACFNVSIDVDYSTSRGLDFSVGW